jgi:dTDP-4-dehydrorhamnose 3,5-epimerase
VILSGDNKKQFWVPPGFGHGFLVLEDSTDLEYKCTDFYDPKDEVTIRWDDPRLNIDWPSNPVSLVERDANAPIMDDLGI